jgi:hypothetical protein
MAMLPESCREDRCRQGKEMRGVEIANRGKSDLKLPPLAWANKRAMSAFFATSAFTATACPPCADHTSMPIGFAVHHCSQRWRTRRQCGIISPARMVSDAGIK